MVVEFQYTLDDLVEAERADASARNAAWNGLAGGASIRLIALAGAVALGNILGFSRTGFYIAFVGGGLAIAWIIVGVVRHRRSRSGKPPMPVEQFIKLDPMNGSKQTLPMLGWGLFICAAVAFFLLLNRRDLSPAPTGTGTPIVAPAGQGQAPWQLLRPLLPWLVIFGLIWFFVFRQLRGAGARMQWQRESSLQLRRRIDADNDRLVVDDVQSKTEMRWSGVRRFVETPNLFLLYISELSFYLIPKRAFASAADADAFRELLRAKVQPPTMAFPVIAPDSHTRGT